MPQGGVLATMVQGDCSIPVTDRSQLRQHQGAKGWARVVGGRDQKEAGLPSRNSAPIRFLLTLLMRMRRSTIEPLNERNLIRASGTLARVRLYWTGMLKPTPPSEMSQR